MCGIAGIVLGRVGPSPEEAAGALRRMTGALAARGPDGEGFHADLPCLLGHRRLAIIDVEGGRQPLTSEDGSVAAVVNGEIYNFAGLRTELTSRGHTFATRSDSEVIVHGYEEWGDAVLDRLEGMFALAVWDRARGRLLLARDRLGEKPLYVAALPGGGVAFASELRSLKHAPGLDTDLDPAALLRYLVLEDLPAPWTILTGVRKLEPGTFVVHERGSLGPPRTYWDVPCVDPADRLTDVREAKRLLRLELARAVKERLVSDVPLGVFLSGGVDSSAIAVFASQAREGDLDTFSIGFDDPTFDESAEARRVATHLGTRHHERRVTAADVQAVVPRIGELLDEPLGDASIVPTHLLARFAREHVTVALGGDGGDELFLGYPTFQAERIARAIGQVPGKLRRPAMAIARAASRLLPTRRGYMSIDFKLRQFLKGVELQGARRHQAWLASFTPIDALAAIAPARRDAASAHGDPIDLHEARMARCASTDSWDRLQYFYLKGYLADGVLTKVDRASMAVGLEVRAPLLDRGVVTLAARIDPGLRLRGDTTKWIFKQAVRPYLPPETTARKKQGFAMPIGPWLAGELTWLLDEELGEARLRAEGVFDPGPIRTLVDEHRAGRADHRKPLWTLLAFQGWWRAWRAMGSSSGSLAAGVLALAAACGGGSGASDATGGIGDGARVDSVVRPTLAIASVEDLGRFPAPSATVAGRDGGTGGALGGKYFWTFGDTFISEPNSIDDTHILSATSGWSSLADPLELVEPVDGAGIPAQLIPYTSVEIAANRKDASNGWALWPGNLIDTGEAEGLVAFHRIKRTDGTGFASEGVGIARLAVDGTVATRAGEDLFAPPDLFTPQQVIGEHVIAFACESVGFLNFGCNLGRAPKARADERAAYEFWDGAAWQPDVANASIVIDQAGNAPSISWNPYLGRWLAVSGKVVSSTILLRTAEQIEGPWDEGVALEASDAGYLAPTSEDTFNYIMIEHPELASADGRSIVISYSRPTTPFQGDVRLARIHLE